MEMWEYMTLTVESLNRRLPIVAQVNGEKVKGESHVPHYTMKLNQLGNEGWEVVGMASFEFPLGMGFGVLLKRRKP